MKAFLSFMYVRVVQSYKTTLLGLGVMVLGFAAEYFVSSPNKIVALLAATAGSILVLYKQRFPPPPTDLKPLP